MTMTKSEYELWKLEQTIVEGLFRRVVDAEHDILRRAGCDPDSPAVRDYMAAFAKSRGAIPPPRTTRTAARDLQRIRHAIWTLVLIEQARRYLVLGGENARLASHAALLAGLYAGNGALNAVVAAADEQKSHKGGTVTGQKIATRARQNDKEIAKLLRRWESSEEYLQVEYPRSAVPYIRKQTDLPTRTIERAIKRLRPRTRQ